jgi:hypothetical protein
MHAFAIQLQIPRAAGFAFGRNYAVRLMVQGEVL